MAFLLLLHEKMRLKRQVNKLTLKQLRYGSRLDRMTKNIERVQKMYSKKQSQLQKQAQLLQSQASVFFQNAMGLGAQNQAFNPYNYSAGAGMTTFVLQQASTMLNSFNGKVQTGYESDGTTPTYKTIEGWNSGRGQLMMNEYIAGTLDTPNYKASEDATKKEIESYGQGKFSPEEYQVFKQAISTAQANQSQAQAMCQQMSTQYQNNISIWLEAQEAQLEAEQDAALAPLEMEQTDMELEKDSIEVQLENARARLQNIEQACSQEIKDSAPKFGF